VLFFGAYALVDGVFALIAGLSNVPSQPLRVVLEGLVGIVVYPDLPARPHGVRALYVIAGRSSPGLRSCPRLNQREIRTNGCRSGAASSR
jgi:hypothetical protein